MKFDYVVALSTAAALLGAGIAMSIIGSPGDDGIGMCLAFVTPSVVAGLVAGNRKAQQ